MRRRGSVYDWQLTEDLGAFLARARSYLRSEPALHTLPLTVTDRLRTDGPHAYGAGTPHFGVCADAGGRVRGAFVRTPPFSLLLTPLPEVAAGDAGTAAAGGAADAVGALVERLAPLVPDLAGVSSEVSTAARFAAAWQRRTGAAATVHQHQRLYRLGTLTPPRPAPPGRARIATEADRELLMRWGAAFQRDVGGPAQADPGGWADGLISYGGATLWETPDGTPAALAGATRRIAGQVRVGTVYTPPEMRRRGYAAAVTAALSRRVRDAGAEQVLLFTDLANPTSNGVYRRIGYRSVGDFDAYGFAPGAPGAHGARQGARGTGGAA